jgi:hypothetical protein
MSPNQEQQFTKYPKGISAWRRHLSGNAWTVLTVIHEKIAGWDKESDAISLSQIEAETTLKRSPIQRALATLQTKDGPVEVTGRGPRGIPVYRIRQCDLPAGDQGDLPTSEDATCPLETTTTDVITAKEERVCKDSLSWRLAIREGT